MDLPHFIEHVSAVRKSSCFQFFSIMNSSAMTNLVAKSSNTSFFPKDEFPGMGLQGASVHTFKALERDCHTAFQKDRLFVPSVGYKRFFFLSILLTLFHRQTHGILSLF